MYDENCVFCQRPEEVEAYKAMFDFLGPQYLERWYIREADGFRIAPTLGALVPGYVLLRPVEHYLSVSHMPLHVQDRLEDLLAATLALVEAAFGSCIVFEHGPMSCVLRGGCCQDHAHLHIVPLPGNDMQEAIKVGGFPVRQIQHLHDLTDNADRNSPYLFLQTQTGERFVRDAEFALSQHFRRWAAARLGIPSQWDWRRYPMYEHIRTTLDTLGRRPWQQARLFEEVEFRRASGEAVCSICQQLYRKHRLAGPIGYDRKQFLHQLCDGTLVKL